MFHLTKSYNECVAVDGFHRLLGAAALEVVTLHMFRRPRAPSRQADVQRAQWALASPPRIDVSRGQQRVIDSDAVD